MKKLYLFNLKATSPNPKSVPAPPPVNVPPPPCAPYCPKPGQVSVEIGWKLSYKKYSTILVENRKERKNCKWSCRHWLWTNSNEVSWIEFETILRWNRLF